ncbi:MAG: hypothetical protein AAGA06_02710 [Pseudomonadota bacterium]
MTKPILLWGALVAAFEIGNLLFGYQVIYKIGYGAFSLLALVIAGTFLWLWVQRSTPLALGMAFGWAGAAGVMAWWWFFNVLSQPEWMQDNPFLFVFLSFSLVGAILHLDVIGRSFALSRLATFAPILAVTAISVFVALSA